MSRLRMPHCYAHPTLYSTQQLVVPVSFTFLKGDWWILKWRKYLHTLGMPGFDRWNWQMELLNCCNWPMASERLCSIKRCWNWKRCSRRNNKIKDLRKQIFNPWECHQARGEYHRLNRRGEIQFISLTLKISLLCLPFKQNWGFRGKRNLKIRLPHINVSFALGWA